MSINWNHFAVIKHNMRSQLKPNAGQYFPKHPLGSQKDLQAFSEFMADERKRPQTGRSWKAEELRLKSHDDLHKLWYVLLIEKNKLKSDHLMSHQMGQMFYGYANIKKVKLSMSRLLTVVNERKKIRNEYRAFLEDEYIAQLKKEEEQRLVKDIEARRERGEETEYTPQEVVDMYKTYKQKKQEKQNSELESVFQRFDDSATTITVNRKARKHNSMPKVRSKLLEEQDMLMIAQQRQKLSQSDILKLHVKNHADLDLRQRRKVMGHIQAQRAMHAKEVFLKELATIGAKIKVENEAKEVKRQRQAKRNKIRMEKKRMEMENAN